MVNGMATSESAAQASAYNYAHFSLEHRTMDRLEGPKVGEAAPDFTAQRLADAEAVKLSDYRGQTVVLETGSATCPIYVGRIGPMNALAQRYPEVAFLVLYTREAHPGENLGPHRSMADKVHHARLLPDADGERRTVLVDDLTGSAHMAYGAMPNTAYVIDGTGTVVVRAQWNDPELIDQTLEALASGGPVPTSPQPGFPARLSQDRATQDLFKRVMERSGQQAIADFERARPDIERLGARPPATR
ncbi:hypothetical protein GCM10009799_45290 [Nocardiopsis rhodophaea]|uniref:Thioredoxin domain-containing protein n=2 Tax=Nocardiopsis rhodophaea TaxID=280238 RepID=A0ABN2TLS3_9ACTN